MSPCCHVPVVFDCEFDDDDPETGYHDHVRVWRCPECDAIWFEDELEKYNNAESGN